jgi:hypothetical protein
MTGPGDGPAPAASNDVNYEHRPGGGEIWLSERIALRPALVQECIQWMESQPGVDQVVYEGPEVLLVDGRFDEALQGELRTWWAERIDVPE